MRLFVIILLFTGFCSFAQRDIQGMEQWKYHVPFNQGQAIADVGDKVYCASKLGLFSYDKQSGELETYTKVEGLNDIEINTINYYAPLDILFIGYKNGNIDIIQNNTIINLSDIKRKQIIGIKTINSIYFHDDLAYVCCSFGVVVYDLKKLQVKDTYSSLGKNGEQQEVFSATVSKDSLFLATDVGVLKGSISFTTNLLDFNSWEHISDPIPIRSVRSVEDRVVALAVDSNYITQWNGSVWDTIDTYSNVTHIFEQKNEVLVLTETELISTDLLSDESPTSISELNTPIQAVHDGSIFWICDAGRGLVRFESSIAQTLTPRGPSLGSIFKINYSNNSIFVNTGGYGNNFARQFGIMIVDILQNADWFNLGYWEDTMLENITDIVSTVQRKDGSIFMASHGFGLIQKDANQKYTVHNQTNSPIKGVASTSGDGFERITDVMLDEDENLWMTNNGLVQGDSSILMLDKDGKWHAYAFPKIRSSNIPERIIVDKLNNKWVTLSSGSLGAGVMVFNEETGDSRHLTTGFENGDLQNTKISDLAVDKDGAVWLVGREGVSFFPNPRDIYEGGEQNDATRPIFEGRPLLEEEFITSIAIDGGNRKWFGSENGLWLMDPTGTEVIKNFNTDNSPMPTNKVNDIEINQETGEVFIGTDLGLVSYRSDATEGTDQCKDAAIVFPNPVKPDYTGNVGITGLSNNAEIKITDTWGNLIYETTANGGAASWDLKDYDGNKAASGVYMILVNKVGRKNSCATRLAIVN